MRFRKLMFALALLPLPGFAAEVETTTITDGIKTWYIENAGVPVVHIDISFEGAGSASDGSGLEGRASLAASMLTEGAGDLDSVAFARALEEKAISIDIDSSSDRLMIHVHCLREHAEAAGKLLAMALSAPRLEESDLARVKSQTISYLSKFDESPMYRARRAMEQKAFAGHPYANAPYGTKASVAAITAEDLRNYMATYVTRGNMMISAGGDVDAELLDDMLTPVIRALPDADADLATSHTKMQGVGEAITVPMKLPQAVTIFAAPGVPRNDNRFYAAYLLNHILGGDALVSRLADGVRKERGLVYSVESSLEERSGIALITGGLATRSKHVAEATAAVKEILNDLREHGVEKKECEDARAYVLGSFPLQLDSSSDVAAVLMMMQIHELGADYLETREAHFKDVSCDDINQLAAELLDPKRFLFVTAGEVAP